MQIKNITLNLNNNSIYYAAAAIIFTLGILLRVWGLDIYPMAINLDELSNVYDGLCIADTGADRWGQRFPVVLRAFGEADHRPALYAWLVSISIKLFGYSVFAGRFPAAVLGCLSLVFMFFSAKKIGGHLFSLLVLLSAVLMPWHIMYSRVAHEGGMLPAFFMSAALLLWIRLKETAYSFKYLALLGFVTGFAVNSYQAAKLVFLLFSIVMTVDIIRSNSKKYAFLKKLGVYYCLVLIGVLPQLVYLITDSRHFFSRAAMTVMPFSFSYPYFERLFQNIYSGLSPDFLFFSFGSIQNLTIARLLTVECFPFYLGIVTIGILFRKTSPLKPLVLLLLLLIAVLPAALTGWSYALRESSVMALAPFFTAAGAMCVYKIARFALLRAAVLIFIVVALANNFYNFIDIYLDSDWLQGDGHHNDVVAAAKKLNDYKGQYRKVLVEDLGNQTYIYIAGFCLKPVEFQQAEKDVINRDNGFDWVKQVDKYYFLPKDKLLEMETDRHTLILLRYKDERFKLVDSSVSLSGNVYFYRGNDLVL